MLQRQGYISAFNHPDLVEAITPGRYRRIAAAVVEWSGPRQQHVLVPWTLVDDAQSAAAFALPGRRRPEPGLVRSPWAEPRSRGPKPIVRMCAERYSSPPRLTQGWRLFRS